MIKMIQMIRMIEMIQINNYSHGVIFYIVILE